MDWESIREQCLHTGDTIKIEKTVLKELPSFFHETHMGIGKQALRQYRDERPTNSLHVHEFADHFLVHVDAFNPEYHPVAHGFLDTPGIAMGTIAGAFAIFLLARNIQSMSFLPLDRENDE